MMSCVWEPFFMGLWLDLRIKAKKKDERDDHILILNI